jgi:two-component system C4-dicarboxylate transport response regulator DctD
MHDPNPARVVVIDDEEIFRRSLKISLELDGFEVVPFADAEHATAQIVTLAPAVVLTDLRLPCGDGLWVLEQTRLIDAELPVVLMTGDSDLPTAIRAIRCGAYDFLEKPFSRERLLAVVHRASAQFGLVQENRRLREQLESRSSLDTMVRGDSRAVRSLRDLIMHLAPTPVDVLLQGEAGTGKKLFARCLHDFGKRAGPFVAIDCSAIPEPLFERELFDHEAGAHPEANTPHIGRIESAENGTLFLDKIEALPLPLQAKLVRVLQERELERPGGNRPTPVNVRVVAATKADLPELIHQGTFRADLLHHFRLASLRIAPLRERADDVLVLFKAFVQQAALRYDMTVPEVSPEQHQVLLSRRWPGNVRELRACADRAILGLPLFVDGHQPLPSGGTFEELVTTAERSLLQDALKRNEGSVQAACEALSIPPATMLRMLGALPADPSKDERPLDGAG